LKCFLVLKRISFIIFLSIISIFGCSKVEYPSQISIKQADKMVDANFPLPTYLPDSYSLTAIYALEHSQSYRFAVSFYGKGANDSGLASIDNAPIRMYVNLFISGGVNIKRPGERVNVAGSYGFFLETDNSYELWWLLPYKQQPGLYEMILVTAKEIPKEELIKIANSVKH
jgi:hypothetical protein